jgi:hypothetical protein
MWTWLNGNANSIWRIFVAVAIAAFMSIGGWTFSQVRDIPEKYPKKDSVIQRLDKFEKRLEQRICDLEKSNNDLRLFLLEYFSSSKEIHSESEEPK